MATGRLGSVLIAMAFFLAGRGAVAQSLSLPQIDQVNGFAMYGTAISGELGANVPVSDDRLFGFGFETVFDLPTNKEPSEKGWRYALAVGYDHMNVKASIGNDRDFRASIRNLPSIMVYFWRGVLKHNGLYFGVGTGVLQLKDARIYATDGTIIKASADTFGLSAVVGYSLAAGPFLEAGYQVRYFPSVAYDNVPASGLPGDLSRDLSASGFLIKLGWEFEFRPDKPAAPTKVVIEPSTAPLEIKVKEMPLPPAQTTAPTVEPAQPSPHTPVPIVPSTATAPPAPASKAN